MQREPRAYVADIITACDAIALDMTNQPKNPPPPVFLRTERARLLNESLE